MIGYGFVFDIFQMGWFNHQLAICVCGFYHLFWPSWGVGKDLMQGLGWSWRHALKCRRPGGGEVHDHLDGGK